MVTEFSDGTVLDRIRRFWILLIPLLRQNCWISTTLADYVTSLSHSICPIHSADERLKEKRDVMLNVDYLGRVFWSPPAIFKSNCRIDIRNFPFDYQYCFLKFASWTQNSDELDLQFLDNLTEVDVDQYTSSNEWTLVARPAYRFVMMSEECGKSIPDLTFFLL